MELEKKIQSDSTLTEKIYISVSGYSTSTMVHGTWNLTLSRKNSLSWLLYYYGAWDLKKFQLVHDPLRIKNVSVSGYTTSMKHETLKTSCGN